MSKARSQRKASKHVNENEEAHHQKPQNNKAEKQQQASWAVVRGLLTCRNVQIQQQQQEVKKIKQPKQKQQHQQEGEGVISEESCKKSKKMRCSGSLCNNTKVMARPNTEAASCNTNIINNNNDASSSSNSNRSNMTMRAPSLNELSSSSASSSLSVSSVSNSVSGLRGMPFRRLSGCYECRMVVDPLLGFTRDPSLRSSISPCPHCGQIFMKPENLELHLAVKHAVSELGPEDTSKNIVEIIFHSSWLKKQSPVCKIERILKVHNTQRTIAKFEEYRESIKSKATKQLPNKKHPRCIADGNELLRFHCTTSVCSLGIKGSSNLCNSIPQCNVCSIIKSGFKVVSNNGGKGILTTATSGKAHDKAGFSGEEEGDHNEIEEKKSKEKRAMLVCRVIAGRVKKNVDQSNNGGGNSSSSTMMGNNMEEYDSVVEEVGAYSNLEELYVFNPRAILPCFVVFYSGF